MSATFSAFADDDAFLTGFKKVEGDEALNQWAFSMETGALETRPSSDSASHWKNLYLAFAVDVRYRRDCYASKQSALCTFLHSGVELNGNMSWNDSPNATQYEVVFIPIEYVTGKFGKDGLDLRATHGALYATVGARVEYLRNLGLAVENRVLATLSAGVAFTSPSQPLGKELGFRWIGSMRVFAGGAADDMQGAATNGALSAGFEGKIGLALDLAHGSIAFTDTTRLEGDLGLGGDKLRLGRNTNRLELKYIRSFCRSEKSGGCSLPRVIGFGGGIRYEYGSTSFETRDGSGATSVDRSAHRLIFFAEIARF